MPIRTKQVHEPPSPEDGVRVLVMYFYPRGIRTALSPNPVKGTYRGESRAGYSAGGTP